MVYSVTAVSYEELVLKVTWSGVEVKERSDDAKSNCNGK